MTVEGTHNKTTIQVENFLQLVKEREKEQASGLS